MTNSLFQLGDLALLPVYLVAELEARLVLLSQARFELVESRGETRGRVVHRRTELVWVNSVLCHDLRAICRRASLGPIP